MTTRQQILAIIYPLFNRIFGDSKRAIKLGNTSGKKASTPFHGLMTTDNLGKPFGFSNLKGKYVLIVNTASDCIYTSQYEELERLHQESGDQVAILGFPSNDFKDQEQGSDKEIAAFCTKNYGVTFPLMKKSLVLKGSEQNPVFAWLSTPELNGWNSRRPDWNFSKYLVKGDGELVNYFGPGVSPLSKEVKSAIAG